MDASTCVAGGGKANIWARDDGAQSYSIDVVLRAQPNSTVRIGLDLGGGSPSGTFTAWMLERARVTVLTAAVNSGAPFDSFVVSHGLAPLHVTAAHRCPCSTVPWTSCTPGTTSAAAGGWPPA